MINTKKLAEIMAGYPDFSYELQKVGEGMKLSIRRAKRSKDGSYGRTITKIYTAEENLDVLHDIIQGKNG